MDPMGLECLKNPIGKITFNELISAETEATPATQAFKKESLIQRHTQNW